jgi:hypothetical protein
MSFKENLETKIRVDRLAQRVTASIGSVSGGFKIDKTDMRVLLEMAGYQPDTRRGQEMYAKDFTADKFPIVLLDNELKIYDTDVDDVLIRKNPTLGEMVKLRNIRKILNDKDVVTSSRAETVGKIRREILEKLDLTFTDADIEAFYNEGVDALEHHRAETVVAVLGIFSEILTLFPPGSGFSGELTVFGFRSVHDWKYGPVYVYSPSKNFLHFYNVVLAAGDSQNPATYLELMDGETEPAAEGTDVLDDLRIKALALPEKKLSID